MDSVPDPHHGRRILITPSPAGALLAPALDAIAEDLGRELEAGLTPEEARVLRTSLVKVIGALASPAIPASASPDLLPLT